MYSTNTGRLLHRGADPSGYDGGRYIGPPGFTSRMTPFGNVDYNGCYPALRPFRYCFEPAFQTPAAAVCEAPPAAVCLYSAETRRLGLGLPEHRYAEFVSDNAHIVKKSPFNDNSTIVSSEDSGGAPMIMKTSGGAYVLAYPLANDFKVDPQYQQAMLDVWQPDRFAESNKPEAYAMASAIRDTCFFKDAVYPDGTLQPISVRATPMCIAAAQAAHAQVYPSLSDCACDLK